MLHLAVLHSRKLCVYSVSGKKHFFLMQNLYETLGFLILQNKRYSLTLTWQRTQNFRLKFFLSWLAFFHFHLFFQILGLLYFLGLLFFPLKFPAEGSLLFPSSQELCPVLLMTTRGQFWVLSLKKCPIDATKLIRCCVIVV